MKRGLEPNLPETSAKKRKTADISTSLADLPEELVSLILSNCSMQSLINLQLTCQSINQSIKSTDCLDKQVNTLFERLKEASPESSAKIFALHDFDIRDLSPTYTNAKAIFKRLAELQRQEIYSNTYSKNYHLYYRETYGLKDAHGKVKKLSFAKDIKQLKENNEALTALKTSVKSIRDWF